MIATLLESTSTPRAFTESHRVVTPHNHLRQTGALNPSERPAEIPLTYLQAFHTDLTTAQDVYRHEARIFQHEFTPNEIRRNVKLTLRTVLPD